MGKPGQIGEISVMFGIVLALRRPIGTGRGFHKAGSDIEKALDPVLQYSSFVTHVTARNNNGTTWLEQKSW